MVNILKTGNTSQSLFGDAVFTPSGASNPVLGYAQPGGATMTVSGTPGAGLGYAQNFATMFNQGQAQQGGGGGGGGGLGGGGGGGWPALLKEYQNALDKANLANEQRYAEGKGVLQSGNMAAGGFLSDAQKILSGSGEEAVAKLDMMDELRRRNLQDTIFNMNTEIDQQLVDQGLTASSEIIPRKTTATMNALTGLEATLGTQQAGLLADTGRLKAGVSAQQAQASQGGAQALANFIADRNDIGPDLQYMQQLINQYAQGQGLANRFSGMVGGGGGMSGGNMFGNTSGMGGVLGNALQQGMNFQIPAMAWGPFGGGVGGHAAVWNAGQNMQGVLNARPNPQQAARQEYITYWTNMANQIRDRFPQFRGQRLTVPQMQQIIAWFQGGAANR